ncbi:MAG: enhanced intracellular survival protein Eis [Armatimonadota bacterium]
MPEVLRTVRLEEAEQFERFLERCYGFWPGFFSSAHPDRAERTDDNCRCYLVLERDGRIVSHVGTFPMDIVVGPARVRCGGVGAVATLPEERGRGYMSRLMEESVRRMRDDGMTLSVLWGDQQRYEIFGYETCGMLYRVRVTRRSLEREHVSPVAVRELDPGSDEAPEVLAPLHARLPYRVERPKLALQLKRRDARVFVTDEPGRETDGYLITDRSWGGNMVIKEIYSRSGREAALIPSMLDITRASSAEVELGPGESEKLERLLAVSCYWGAHPQGMFRIVDWGGLLRDLRPVLEVQCVGLPPFRLAVGCHWAEEVEWATVEWDGAEMGVEPGWEAADGVEMGLRELTAAVLGGPHPHRTQLGLLGRALPVPLHIPSLDHV